jgi:hypothetical protein
MRRLVTAAVLAVMELALYPLVSMGVVPPWPAGYAMIAGIVGMGIIAITLV